MKVDGENNPTETRAESSWKNSWELRAGCFRFLHGRKATSYCNIVITSYLSFARQIKEGRQHLIVNNKE